MRVILNTLLLFIVPVLVFAESTSPNMQLSEELNVFKTEQIQEGAGDSGIITFSELPTGTFINNQYNEVGIIFGGSDPFITNDSANPSTPVLSGTPQFQGDIDGKFVKPGTNDQCAVQSFTLDAGYFDELGSTRIEWFDPDGKKLGQRINSRHGIEQLKIEGGNIASWRIGIVKNEPAGYAIDNVFFVPIGPSILFREKSGAKKDGSWGFESYEIPGFDHVGFQMENVVYESHPGYPDGTYVSANGQESVPIVSTHGVQSQHSKATFKQDSTSTDYTPVVDFEEIPIQEELASQMRNAIASVQGYSFQFIDYSLEGLEETLSPVAQKGGDGSFTCVGLIEWSAEQAGYNDGEGFIKNCFESFTVPDPRTMPPKLIDVPLLSPQLLNYALKGQQLLKNTSQWLQGLFDPVDFIMMDPLGRKLGFVQGIGLLNEIPNAFYSGNGGVEQLFIPNPIPGTYKVKLVGTDADVFVAIGTSGSSESFSGFLAEGETKVQHISVKPKAGTGGDVDGDGNVDNDDIQALIPKLNHFTDGLGDPGDLDGDGLLSNADLALLTKLIKILKERSISVDIKPGSCPNPLNIANKGKLPVAILGTSDFDVTEVDPDSVRLAGVAPIRWSYEDVATPFKPSLGKVDCFNDCNEYGSDGYMDITFKFDTQEIVEALVESVPVDVGIEDRDCIVLKLRGNLLDEKSITGEDVVWILKKGKP